VKALYQARISDLGPGDLVLVICSLCDHRQSLTPAELGSVPGDLCVMNLAPRFRCRNCDERGRVDIRVRWAEDYSGPQ
jgi:hypothetical protein